MTRIAHDDILGEIDVDRMEVVMNREVETMRQHASRDFTRSENLVDHFTRNSPQMFLRGMRASITRERFESYARAARDVMYELGQTAVPQGFLVAVDDGRVRLVPNRPN
ncbi:MAG: hypothetical protein H7Z43_05600 [Clostridia bacterium]|nr:hypothetical protein [Deltaproteobacteria bacterium]